MPTPDGKFLRPSPAPTALRRFAADPRRVHETESSLATVKKQYSFVLSATSKRRVTVTTTQFEKTVDLNPNSPIAVGPFELLLASREIAIRFEADRRAVVAGYGDTRALASSVAFSDANAK